MVSAGVFSVGWFYMHIHVDDTTYESVSRIQKRDGYVVVTTPHREVQLFPDISMLGERGAPKDEDELLDYVYRMVLRIASVLPGLSLTGMGDWELLSDVIDIPH